MLDFSGLYKVRSQQLFSGVVKAREQLDNALKKELSMLYNDKCVICDYGTVVEAHHIIPVRYGGPTCIPNLITLCSNHHKEADRDLINQAYLFELSQSCIG